MLFPAQTGIMQNSFTKSIVFITGAFIALLTSGSKDKLTPPQINYNNYKKYATCDSVTGYGALTYKIKSKWKPNLMTPPLL